MSGTLSRITLSSKYEVGNHLVLVLWVGWTWTWIVTIKEHQELVTLDTGQLDERNIGFKSCLCNNVINLACVVKASG